ncbi:MAG: outer membrane beta-barrel protein [Vulcanimicrobiota bacterium]
MRRLLWLFLTASAWGQSPAPAPPASSAPAQEPTQVAVPAESEPELKFNGYVQSSYSANFNAPSDGRNLYHGYDERTNRLRLDVLNLNLQYALDEPDRTGFRLDLTGGGSMPRVDAASGLFRDAYSGYTNTDFDVRQAFLSHTFENGFRVDVGKFATHLGYELMDGVDGRNPNATRALTFTYSPFTHTGMRVSYPIDDTLSVTGLLVLGADNFQDTNRSLSVGAQLNYHPTDDFSLVANFYQGPEQIRNDRNQRQLWEFIANYKVTEAITLGADVLRAREQGLALDGGTVQWNSLVLYWTNRLDDHFSLNFRQEWFNDPDGARILPGSHYSGFTVTPEYRITEDWVVRMDFRFDRADRPVFDRRGQLVHNQNTFFLGQSYKF